MPDLDKIEFTKWLSQHIESDTLLNRVQRIFAGWNGRDPNRVAENIVDVLWVLEEAVGAVERFSYDVRALHAKAKLEAAFLCLQRWSKLTFQTQPTDELLLQYLISSVVEQRNAWFGKDWFDVVK